MKMNHPKSSYPLAIVAVLLAVFFLGAIEAPAITVLAGWESGGLANSGPSPFAPGVAGTGLTITGLTRGSGVGSTTTANVWGGNNWTNAGIADSESQAINGNKFATFAVAPQVNYTVSFSAVDKFFYSHSGTGPGSGMFQYSLDGVNFNDVQPLTYAASGSVTIDLSGISDLQNVAFGTTVTFRIVNWGATGTSGTWYIPNGNSSGSDFEIVGTIVQIPTGLPPSNLVVTPANVTTNAGGTVNFTVTANGDLPTYSWYAEPLGQSNVISDTNLISTAGATLTLANVSAINTANYQVVLANSAGSATSSVVKLTVLDPGIAVQPGNMTNVLNDLDTFTATAVSSAQCELLWYYNGVMVTNSIFNALSNSMTIFVTNNPAATNLAGYFLVASNQYGMVTSAVVTANIVKTPPVEITRWDFNVTNNYTATNPLASIGNGTAFAVPTPQVTNFTFAPGALFDPSQLAPGATNQGWTLSGFASTATNKTAGFQFNVSTVGYTNLMLTWTERHSATGSKYMRVQYTTNGTDFIDGDVITVSAVAYQFYTSDLSAKPGVNNNPNFGVRLVAEYENTATGDTVTNYAGATSGFGASGTIRVDLMTIFGSMGSVVPVPIPLSIRQAGTNVVLTWSDPGALFSLQAAPQLNATFNTVSGAASPYTNALTGKQQYFRLKSN